MSGPSELERLRPLLVADLFPELGRELVGLLRSLDEDAWHLPTRCSEWSVRDLVAHLLDTACRRISLQRDSLAPLTPDVPPAGYRDLVDFLNDLNAQWVVASKRLSPRLLTDLVEFTEPELSAVMRSMDPWSPAMFPVSWVGESESLAWFDVARELTERWHHQQQIRVAVDAPRLSDPRFVAPVFETFVRALPFRYRAVSADRGITIAVRIGGEEIYAYSLVRQESGWDLFRGVPEDSTTAIELDEEVAWLLFTKGIDPREAREKARVSGDVELAQPYFEAVAVMA
jgi:uncharacterized protein (TIGR03083 family)